MTKHSIRRLVAAIALAAAAPFAIAGPTTIFGDLFNRPDGPLVGEGWSEIERGPQSVQIVDNTLRLSREALGNDGTAANPDAAVTQTISTLGYRDIEVFFSWAPMIASERLDFLNVAWKKSTDTTYSNVASLALGGEKEFHYTSYKLGEMANNTSIDLRFWTSVDVNDEGAFVDFVLVDGVSEVPEPGSIALIGLALAGMGVVARRKRP
jgi:hypothetical protein